MLIWVYKYVLAKYFEASLRLVPSEVRSSHVSG